MSVAAASSRSRSILLSLGSELLDAGMTDPSYLRKAITYCTEFLALFPDEDENTLINQRRNIADAYLYLNDTCPSGRGIQKYRAGLSDERMGLRRLGRYVQLFNKPTEDLKKAKEIYELGLAKTAPDDRDRDVLEERLEDCAGKTIRNKKQSLSQ
jgi:hypothetical protein